MEKYYSPSQNGFFDVDIRTEYEAAGTWPSDAVLVTEEHFAELIAAQEAGNRIVSGDDGMPVAAEPPPLTTVQILSSNTIRRDQLMAMATAKIAPFQDAVDLGIATAEESQTLTTWKQYRVALNRLDLNAAAVEWPTARAWGNVSLG